MREHIDLNIQFQKKFRDSLICLYKQEHGNGSMRVCMYVYWHEDAYKCVLIQENGICTSLFCLCLPLKQWCYKCETIICQSCQMSLQKCKPKYLYKNFEKFKGNVLFRLRSLSFICKTMNKYKGYLL